MQQLREQNRNNEEAMRHQRDLIEQQKKHLREAEEKLRALSSHASSQRSQPLRGSPTERQTERKDFSLTPTRARSKSPGVPAVEPGLPATIPEGAVLVIGGKEYHISPKKDPMEWYSSEWDAKRREAAGSREMPSLPKLDLSGVAAGSGGKEPPKDKDAQDGRPSQPAAAPKPKSKTAASTQTVTQTRTKVKSDGKDPPGGDDPGGGDGKKPSDDKAVSYTHLTLPTILRV